jgi:hypothetical protein
MNPRVSHQKTVALTLVEVLVVIIVLAVLAAVLLPALSIHHTTKPTLCVYNMKQIVFSFRIWAGDNNDKYPMQVSVTNGGTMELAGGRNAWINFLVMSNEISTPKVLICPQDVTHLPPAANFSSQLADHVSYFVGMDANASNPQSILSGDDNFAIGSVPVKPGLLELSANAPITWTAQRHMNQGYIGLADGSIVLADNSSLTNWLQKTGVATNRLAIP